MAQVGGRNTERIHSRPGFQIQDPKSKTVPMGSALQELLSSRRARDGQKKEFGKNHVEKMSKIASLKNHGVEIVKINVFAFHVCLAVERCLQPSHLVPILG